MPKLLEQQQAPTCCMRRIRDQLLENNLEIVMLNSLISLHYGEKKSSVFVFDIFTFIFQEEQRHQSHQENSLCGIQLSLP